MPCALEKCQGAMAAALMASLSGWRAAGVGRPAREAALAGLPLLAGPLDMARKA